MHATMDRYTQMRVFFTSDELELLGKQRMVHGNLWRMAGGNIPFNIHATPSDIWKVYGSPKKKCYEEKRSYEMYIPRTEIGKIKQGKLLYIDMTGSEVAIRSAFVSRDDVL